VTFSEGEGKKGTRRGKLRDKRATEKKAGPGFRSLSGRGTKRVPPRIHPGREGRGLLALGRKRKGR